MTISSADSRQSARNSRAKNFLRQSFITNGLSLKIPSKENFLFVSVNSSRRCQAGNKTSRFNPETEEITK